MIIKHKNKRGKRTICICKNCGCEFTDNIKGFVDHNHKTGIVRGVLCSKCNSLLGFANDNICILTNAIQYLEKTKECE